MDGSRVPASHWWAAGAFALVWLALAYALSAFSDKLPELIRIPIRSALFSTLLVPLGATAIALMLHRRSLKRSVGTFAGAFAFASILVAQQYWRETTYFSGERLAAARRERQLEMVRENLAERDFKRVLNGLRNPSQPGPTPTASTR